jgi:hypothetical protein
MYSAIQHPTTFYRREKRYKERVRPRFWKNCCCHTLLFNDTQERTLKNFKFKTCNTLRVMTTTKREAFAQPKFTSAHA